MANYDERIPRDALIKESRKFALQITASDSAEDIWKQLPEKNQEKLWKEYCTIRGKGLERLAAKWLEGMGFEVHLNQKLQGKKRKQEVDVIAVKDEEVYLIECKGIATKVSDKMLAGITEGFQDIINNDYETKYGDIEGLVIVSSTGFTESAIEKIKEMIDETGPISSGIMGKGLWPQLYEYSGGEYKRIAGKPSEKITEV